MGGSSAFSKSVPLILPETKSSRKQPRFPQRNPRSAARLLRGPQFFERIDSFSMDAETKKAAYGTHAYHSAGAALMSFQPIQKIHQHICAFHPYAHDRTRAVRAHHFCTHFRPDMHQCVIYDGPGDNARLIGIEYIVTDEVFKSLPDEEKKYWHSHKYEVESGLLMLVTKAGVPNAVADTAEQPAMLALRKTYGKTIHTWVFDEHPDIPMGPPQLMMSWTDESQTRGFQDALDERDKELGVSTEAKREVRETYIPKDGWEPDVKADYPTHSGKSVYLKPVEVDVKLA